jgi:hypothetical protein
MLEDFAHSINTVMPRLGLGIHESHEQVCIVASKLVDPKATPWGDENGMRMMGSRCRERKGETPCAELLD